MTVLYNMENLSITIGIVLYFYGRKERRTTLMSLRLYILIFLLLPFALVLNSSGSDLAGVINDTKESGADNDVSSRLSMLTDSLAVALESKDMKTGTSFFTSKIEAIIAENSITDTLLLSNACYFAGHHYLQNNLYRKAVDYFSKSLTYREKVGVTDRRYALGLSNMAVALQRAGDYNRAYAVGKRGLEVRRMVSGNDTAALAVNYLNLAGTMLELNNTGEAIALAEAGLEIARLYHDRVPQEVTADLYQDIGLSLYRVAEYNKSLVYCRQALKIYNRSTVDKTDSKILILNTISQLYRRLGQPDEAESYFKKGLAIKDGKNTQDKYLLYINYAGFLAENGRIREGEKVLEDGRANVSRVYGPRSREYYMMLASAAEFANSSSGDPERALELYNEYFDYIKSNPWDVSMKRYLIGKYTQTLFEAGMYAKIVDVTDELVENTNDGDDIRSVAFSQEDLNVLMVRYRSLNALARESGDNGYLRLAIETGRRISALYDRQRLEMSEEESRTDLSAFSREIYTGIIDDYSSLYKQSGDRKSLEGLFEFSERSKMAGFLASMREFNAAKFSLPANLVELDNDIRKEIGFYKELIVNEQAKAVPDTQRLATWESATFSLLRSRDSLVNVFEMNYPSYYNLKIRNEVTPLADINRVIGNKANLLSYVLTDDKLYIFVTNLKHTEIITQDIDSTFFTSLTRFRGMLSEMPVTSSVRKPFNEFMDLAYELYEILLKPVVPYLKGEKIVISPDNILSYIPFETLVTEEFRSPDLLYREAPFALKKYRFSYIYSVTLSSETQEKSRSLNNRLLAFAPSYDGMEISDSLLASWPNLRGEIRDLPYAVLEAEDAVDQCGGKAYLEQEATEDTYKREANKYEIIHLAMHTLVDDIHPTFSKMIFSLSQGRTDDGMLNTYEVYNTPLKAMMVVLSSCNTGTGKLVSGEGILSLARGFLYAGSRSAVMSMWAVEDMSASAVMHSFYKNMRSGQTKSSALRNARLRFLRSADQERSHPYYWSALVIYGDDTALWYNRVKLYTSLLILMTVATLLVATVYRGPKS
jgi:CHAT domain-containing protein